MSSNATDPLMMEIAHVLFIDVVGYSKLLIDQQTLTLRQLQDTIRKTDEFRRSQAARQLISLPTGDGVALVFFGDPVAPVRCAIEISLALQNNPQIKLRMGVHSGPVHRIEDINASMNVAGGGINLAQRVMDCGDAGHILLSKRIADDLSQLSNWTHSLHDLGEVAVKHGIRVHVFNLHIGDVGNPEVPMKFRSAASIHAANALELTKLSGALLYRIGSWGRWWIVAGASLVLVTALAIGARFRFSQGFTKSEIQTPSGVAIQSVVAAKPLLPMTPRNLKPVLLRPSHIGTVWSVAYSPDGKYAASAGEDKKILLWKTDNWSEPGKEMLGHNGPVYSVAFSPDSRTLASASEDGSIKLWDMTTTTPIPTTLPIDEKQAAILRVAFSPNGEYLASCASKDVTNGCEEIRIWEVRHNWNHKPLVGVLSRVHAIAFSPDSVTLVTVGLNKQMCLWDSRTGEEKDLKTFDQELISLSFFPGNGYLALGVGDGTIRLWHYDSSDNNSAKSLRSVTIRPKRSLNVVVAASPDNKTLASAVPSQEIRLWDIDSGLFTSLSSQVGTSQSALAFSPDGQTLISGDYGKGLVRVWR